MRTNVADRIRVYLSKKYLDIAERLPKFNHGFIARLQSIKQHQRETSKDGYEKSRPPEGTELKFLSFRLVEIFFIEDFNKLYKGLISLFPGLEEDFMRDFSVDFRSLADSVYGGHRKMLGFIYRDKRRYSPIAMESTIMRELPEEVSHIDVWLHKFLPSVISLSFDVYLTEKATEHLLKLQQEKYLSTVRFYNLIPWKSVRRYSSKYSERVMANEILGWIDNLRSNVENCLRPFIRGHLIIGKSKCKSKLPAIEVYKLKGMPEKEEEIKTWIKDARHWLDSMGFRFYFGYYSNGIELFMDAYSNSTSCIANRLIILSDSKDEYDMRFIMDSILPFLVISELLSSALETIQGLRYEVFEKLKHRRFQHLKLNRYIKLNNVINREFMMIERMSIEFEQQKRVVRDFMDAIRDMKEFVIGSERRLNENLDNIMLRNIEYRLELYKKYIMFISDSSSKYLSALNLKAMYRLQRNILYFTIIVTIVTVAGLVMNSPNIQNILKSWLQAIVDTLSR